MDSAGARLAQAQVDGHRRIDEVYAALADAVEAEVLRWASGPATDPAGGSPRLPLGARAAILVGIGHLLDRARIPLTEAIAAARQEAIVAAETDHEPLPRDVIADFWARHEIYRTLGTDRASVLSQTGAILISGIAAKLAAPEIAQRVRQYFSPWFAPRRNVAGAVVRAGRQGAISHWPGRAGMASQHARLVLLYQTSEAHGQTILRIARRDDLYVRFYTSKRHRHADSCDQHARADVGFGPGVYRWGDAPKIPQHVNCRCYINTVERDTGARVQRT